MNKAVVLVVVITLAILGGWWIKGRGGESVPLPIEPNMADAEPAGTDVGMEEGTVPETITKTFTVTGSNFAFDPSTITVSKGDTVKIIFKNSGGTHDWKIDEFRVATPRINGGQEATVEFVADKAGSFEYYCSVGTHRQMGMKGTLIVN